MAHCFLALAVVFLGSSVSFAMLATGFAWWRMKTWVQLHSRVKSASLETRHNPIGAGVLMKEYRPKIEYEYEYRGKRYVGRRLTFRDARLWTYDQAKAERQLIDPGTELRVYVSPSNPSKAIMRPVFEYRYIDFLAMAFTTGLAVAGVGAWVSSVMCF
jgi:hypothetical protein